MLLFEICVTLFEYVMWLYLGMSTMTVQTPTQEHFGMTHCGWKSEEFNISALIDYSLLVWQDHEWDFPIISHMAHDFLAIPGVSVSVERLFLQSMYLCGTELWGLLKAATIMEAMCAWQ